MATATYPTSAGVSGAPFGLREKGSYTNIWYNWNFGTIGGACHQRRLFIPFGGQYIRVRFIYEAPTNALTWEVNSFGVASGRTYSETEPKDLTGAPTTWQFAGPIQATAGSATAGSTVETYSQWFTVYIIPDAVFPNWGTLIMRSKNTVAAAGMGRVFTGSTGRLNLVNAVNARYQDTYEYAAASTNIGAAVFPLTSSSDPGDVNRNITAFQYQIEPVGKNYTVGLASDSRGQGETSTGNLASWMPRSCEAVSLATGTTIGYESYCLTSSSHATFQAFAMDRLSKSGRKQLDLFALQGASTNDTNPWTDATIAADMARNLDFAATCRANNVQPAFVLMYPSTTATTPDLVANWVKLNTALLNSGVPCFDFFNQPLFTTGTAIPSLPQDRGINGDAVHLNDVGHAIAARLIGIPGIRTYLGL